MTELILALLLGLAQPEKPRIIPAETPQNAPEQTFDPVWDIWGSEKENAKRVAWCESRFDPGAENGRYIGLFQISSTLWGKYYGYSKEELFDPEVNSQVALKIWSRSGDFRQWSCKP